MVATGETIGGPSNAPVVGFQAYWLGKPKVDDDLLDV